MGLDTESEGVREKLCGTSSSRNTVFDISKRVGRDESKRIRRSINDSEPLQLIGIQTNSSDGQVSTGLQKSKMKSLLQYCECTTGLALQVFN